MVTTGVTFGTANGLPTNHAKVIEDVVLGLMTETGSSRMKVSDEWLFNAVAYHFHKQTQESLPANEYEHVLEQMRIRGKVGYYMKGEKSEARYHYFPAGMEFSTSTPSFAS